MKRSENIKPLSYLKASAAEVIEKLQTDHQSLVITQNGEAAMVAKSVANYEQTQKALALLIMLAPSQQALVAGKMVSSAGAFRRLRVWRGLASAFHYD